MKVHCAVNVKKDNSI